jgi:K+-sensing histidine kinase KdpD
MGMGGIISSRSRTRADFTHRPNLRLVSSDYALEAATRTSQESAKTGVIACLTAESPSNNELLLKASAAALEREAELYAVLLYSPRTKFKRSQVHDLIDAAIFASSLGAKIVWLDSSDPIDELLQFARQSRVGRIFVARNRPTLFSRLFKRAAYSVLLGRAKDCRIDVVGFERRN